MSEETLAQTIEIVAAYVANHNIRPEDVPAFIASTHGAVLSLDAPQTPSEPDLPAEDVTPAVTARKSLASRDHIVSMIDGKPYKTLRRHLATHGLTPEQYRERYKLKPDYPMVAPSYSETRKALAQKIGLGRKAKDAIGTVVESAKALIGAETGSKTDGSASKASRGGAKATVTPGATKPQAAAKPRRKLRISTEQQQASEPQEAEVGLLHPAASEGETEPTMQAE